MELLLKKRELKRYLGEQLEHFYPDKYGFRGKDIDVAFDIALDKAEYCFSHISIRGYCDSKQTYLSHLHSDQWSQFLYYFSNTLWENSNNDRICSKVILLNKLLNGMFYSYKTKLPDIFLLVHPVGTIIGNGLYSDFLVIMQNVTIGERREARETLGKGLFLGAGAKVIGTEPIGDRCSIGSNVLIYKEKICGDSIVYMDKDSGERVIKENGDRECRAQRYFNIKI